MSQKSYHQTPHVCNSHRREIFNTPIQGRLQLPLSGSSSVSSPIPSTFAEEGEDDVETILQRCTLRDTIEAWDNSLGSPKEVRIVTRDGLQAHTPLPLCC